MHERNSLKAKQINLKEIFNLFPKKKRKRRGGGGNENII
jgi:hypothetical protein